MSLWEKIKANWIKILCVALSAALLIALAVFIGVEVSSRNKQKAESDRLSEELSPLLTKRSTLFDELEKEQNAYKSAKNGLATVQFVAEKPAAALYANVRNIMEEKAVSCGLSAGSATCVIGLSAAHMPDSTGMMTAQQAQELQAAGWSFCYFLSAEEEEGFAEDKNSSLSTWIAETAQAASSIKIEIAPAICFGKGTYSYDAATLLGAGFTFVGNYFTRGNYCAKEKSEGLWLNPIVGYCEDYAPRYLSQTVTKGANIVFSFLGDTEEEVADVEADDYDQLSKMFLTVFKSVAADNLRLTSSFSDMISVQEEELSAEECAEFEAKIAALQAEIAEVEKQINAVYDKYK